MYNTVNHEVGINLTLTLTFASQGATQETNLKQASLGTNPESYSEVSQPGHLP